MIFPEPLRISTLPGIALAASAAFWVPTKAAHSQQTTCSASDGLTFLCGAIKPEDMKRIRGTRFIVTSGFGVGSGLKLVDARAKTFTRWYTAQSDQITPDTQLYPDCATAPDPALFNARGLSLRRLSRSTATLHVVNHGGREAIEVFRISIAGKGRAPTLAWQGCQLLPPGHVGNAVATYGDGTVLVSVLTRPGTTITDFERGQKTGGIFERASGEAAFTLIPGTELPGNNGLETSVDDRAFYTVAFGLRAVAIFKRGQTSGPEAIIPAPGFMPDNVHWDGRRLLATGMNSDEPACGGTRKIINEEADKMLCPRGWKVARLDPRTRQFRIVAQGDRTEGFNGVSQAVILDGTLWLGSYQADRIAYRKLRWPRKAKNP